MSLDPDELATFATHKELCKITDRAIFELCASDSLLNDIPEHPTLDEIQAKISLIKGQSQKLYIKRDDNSPSIEIIIPATSTTVANLKQLIRQHHRNRKSHKVKNSPIAWRSIWRKYDLTYGGELLSDANRKLSDYNVKHKSTLYIKKKKFNRRKSNT